MSKSWFFVFFLMLASISFGETIFNPICDQTGLTNCEVVPFCQEQDEPYMSCWSFPLARDVCCYSPPPPGGETTPPEPDMDNECAYLDCIPIGEPAPCTWLTYPNETFCDDDNLCTGTIIRNDRCTNGKCIGPPVPFDPETHCCHPDYGVSPLGECVDENCVPYSDGTACGDPTSTQCNGPDICIDGVCDLNWAEDRTLCNDDDDCTVRDDCHSGECAGTYPNSTLQRPGARRLKMDLGAYLHLPDTRLVSVQLTSRDWPCLRKYVGLNGLLYDDPIFETVDTWNDNDPIIIYGPDIVSSSIYKLYTHCQGSEVFKGSNEKIAWGWGDIVGDFVDGAWQPPQGVVDFNDITATVQVFTGDPNAPPLIWADTDPDWVDGVVDFNDIGSVVDAFYGYTYPYSVPCE